MRIPMYAKLQGKTETIRINISAKENPLKLPTAFGICRCFPCLATPYFLFSVLCWPGAVYVFAVKPDTQLSFFSINEETMESWHDQKSFLHFQERQVGASRWRQIFKKLCCFFKKVAKICSISARILNNISSFHRLTLHNCTQCYMVDRNGSNHFKGKLCKGVSAEADTYAEIVSSVEDMEEPPTYIKRTVYRVPRQLSICSESFKTSGGFRKALT